MNSKELARHLGRSINWQRFVNLSASLGDQLNDAQWRFFKAVVFESSMEAYSDGSVRYVGREGCDLLVSLAGVEHTVEMKYTENALYTAKGSKPRVRSQSITLMNSKGTNSHGALPAQYADYLLVVGCRAAALIDTKSLTNLLTINGDSISVQIPTADMQWVFQPDQLTAPSIKPLNLRETITHAVKQALTTID